jgi:hypothetical protein
MNLVRRPARVTSRIRESAARVTSVILPFDRARLRERNALDDAEDQAAAAQRSPGERVEISLDLSQLVRDLAHATGADRAVARNADLAEKARLYAAPLRILAARR